MSQACESTIQSEDHEPHPISQPALPGHSSGPAPGSPGEAGGTPPSGQAQGAPCSFPRSPPTAHVLKFDSFLHKSTRPSMPILEAPGPLVTPNEARLPGEGGNGGSHPEDRGTGSPSPQCPGAGWLGSHRTCLPSWSPQSSPSPILPGSLSSGPPLPLIPSLLLSGTLPPPLAGAVEPES